MASIARFTDTRDPDAMVTALRTEGAVLVDEFIPPATVAAIRAEVDDAVEAAEAGMRTVNPPVQAFYGPHTKHVSALAAVSPTFADEVIAHPTYTAICNEVLLPSCSRYQLNLGHLIARGPGAEAQFPTATKTCGRTSRVRTTSSRSRRWSRSATSGSTPARRASCPGATTGRGNDTRTGRHRRRDGPTRRRGHLPRIHHPYAGTNSTADEWRLGAHVSFTLGWLRTEENNSLAVPPAVARTLSPRAQELLGYAVHDAIADGGGYLGMVRMRDPMELLADGDL